MATKVFTAADITLTVKVGAAPGWDTVAAAMTTMEVDSGNVTTGTTTGTILVAQGTLIDDASLPANIITSAVQFDFDYRVISTGASPTTTFTTPGPFTSDTAVNAGDVTGHHTSTFNTFGNFGGTTRADLWLAGAISWTSSQTNGVAGSTTRIVVSNFTATISYVNVGVGSWFVKLAAMNNPTGSTDGSSLPALAFVSVVGAGTIDLPVADTAGAFIYVDGSVTPVAVAGLPAGFSPADTFTLWNNSGLVNADDSVRYSGVTLFDTTVTLAVNRTYDQVLDLTGCTLTKIGALVGDTVLGTMTVGTAGGFASITNDLSSTMDAFTFIAGTYTTITPRVISVTPNKGTTSGGTAVTIRGEGFSSAATGVEFDGTTLTDIVFVSDTVITGVTPQHISGQVDVEVIGVGTLTDGYRYVVPRVLLPPIPVRSPLLQPGDASG